MTVDKSYSSYVQIGFACLGALALPDVILLLSSEEYRDALGRTHGVFHSFTLGRLTLSILMIVFYGMAYLKVREGSVLSSVLVWHGLLYGVVGVGLCLIPFGGFLLAPLTPIGALYLSAILWTPFQFAGSLGVAVAFVAFNTYLVLTGLRKVSPPPVP